MPPRPLPFPVSLNGTQVNGTTEVLGPLGPYDGDRITTSLPLLRFFLILFGVMLLALLIFKVVAFAVKRLFRLCFDREVRKKVFTPLTISCRNCHWNECCLSFARCCLWYWGRFAVQDADTSLPLTDQGRDTGTPATERASVYSLQQPSQQRSATPENKPLMGATGVTRTQATATSIEVESARPYEELSKSKPAMSEGLPRKSDPRYGSTSSRKSDTQNAPLPSTLPDVPDLPSRGSPPSRSGSKKLAQASCDRPDPRQYERVLSQGGKESHTEEPPSKKQEVKEDYSLIPPPRKSSDSPSISSEHQDHHVLHHRDFMESRDPPHPRQLSPLKGHCSPPDVATGLELDYLPYDPAATEYLSYDPAVASDQKSKKVYAEALDQPGASYSGDSSSIHNSEQHWRNPLRPRGYTQKSYSLDDKETILDEGEGTPSSMNPLRVKSSCPISARAWLEPRRSGRYRTNPTGPRGHLQKSYSFDDKESTHDEGEKKTPTKKSFDVKSFSQLSSTPGSVVTENRSYLRHLVYSTDSPTAQRQRSDSTPQNRPPPIRSERRQQSFGESDSRRRACRKQSEGPDFASWNPSDRK